MRLVSFDIGDGARTGTLVDSAVVDLRRAAEAHFREQGADAARAADMASGSFGHDMTDVLSGGRPTMDLIEALTSKVVDKRGDPNWSSALHEREQVRLLAPVTKPGKVIGIGGNYPELRATWPKPPVSPPMFQKARSCVVGPEDDVVLPTRSRYVQPELELVAVIGTTCRNVAVEDAWGVVAGYTIGNDLTAIDILMTNWVTRIRPDIVEHGLPGEAPFNLALAFEAKSFDTFGVIGPELVTPDELDPTALSMRFAVNGEVIQSGNTGDMIVTIPEIIAFVSSVCTLEPGDLLFSGARGHLPAVKPGDEMEHEISSIGRFVTRCVAEADGGAIA
jgi:2-keto-4-pentenoate hydratase/2-oxohepta-3-ene-1,7-dioic acid hydratase in catechol pathway